MTIQKATENIMKYLCVNFNRYTEYHQKKLEPTTGDTLISDVIDFFASRNYNTNIVDLLMQISADALQLELSIYQNNSGRVQVYNFTSDNPKYFLHLKFSHDPKHPQGNHYDAITKIQANTNVQIISERPEMVSPTIQATNPSEAYIDLTGDDEHSDQTYISSDYEQGIRYCPGHTPVPHTEILTSSSDHHSDTTYSSSQFSIVRPNTTSVAENSGEISQPETIASDLTIPDFTLENLTSPESPIPDPFLDNLTSTQYSQQHSDNFPYSDEESNPPRDLDLQDDEQQLLQSVSRGRPFPTWYFNSVQPTFVNRLPDNIDGTSLFKIKIKDHMWHAVTGDKRHFRMLTSSREGFYGERRIGTCKGSFVCNNSQCPFILTSHRGQPNKVSWRNVTGIYHFKVCAICDHVAQRKHCGAKKLIEYDYSTKIATVYHLGTHKCCLRLSKHNPVEHNPSLQVPQTITGSAKQVGLRQIISLIDAGDMDAAEREAEVWLDRRKVKRQMEAMNPQQGLDHNSFDAVGILKQKTDQKDPFYIYKIGNKNLGGGTDFVFKSSRQLAKIALAMDVDGPENILQMENAYFDATHTRVYGFKSLGLWVIHPAMRKILRLASMEIRSENYKDISLFFILFNAMLSVVKGVENYKFNPRYFVCDEAGANYKAIAEVYGKEFAATRVKGCQWHFKSDVKNHVNKLAPIDQESFVNTCNAMCDVTTVAAYYRLKATLDKLTARNPEIKPFVMYWDPRRSHIFKPFRGGGLPGVNLSEQGNASFKPSKTMRLVHAAKYDVATMMEQEKEIELFEQNLLKCAGRGPSAGVRDAKDRAQQMKVAEDFVNILDNEEDVMMEATQGNKPSMYMPKAQTKHRAPKKKFETKPPRAAPKRKITKQSQKSENADLTKELEAKLALAMEVCNSELTTSRKNKVDNPPMLIYATWRITKCRGCKQPITPDDKQHPHSFVFRRRGVVGYFNTLHNKWIDSEQNIHFHLNMGCVRKHDTTIEKRHISCNDEVFCSLSREEMIYLNDQGFLKPVAEKKME